MIRRGGLWCGTALVLLLGACRTPPDIPVGPLGVPFDIESDQVSSFICANEKHFSIAYRTDGIVFSTGLGVQQLKISGSAAGVRYDGGNFTIVTTANRAVVYFDDMPVMTDCVAIQY